MPPAAIDARSVIDFFTKGLTAFKASSSGFRVLRSLPHGAVTTSANTRQLIVLDSSFNPPTVAHAEMIHSAVRSSSVAKPRILLLLAVQNADKAPAPASFPTRLAMMESFGHGILDKADVEGVDIGVTTEPYFPDKASAMEETYAGMRQVFLVGYDTLIRVFDAKYYPEGSMDSVIQPFLAKASLRVTLRTDGKWGGREEQHAFWEGLEAWQRKEVELVEGVGGAVSSSRVREKVCQGEDIGELVGEDIQWWIKEANLYVEDE